jgi:hypothetical protein
MPARTKAAPARVAQSSHARQSFFASNQPDSRDDPRAAPAAPIRRQNPLLFDVDQY